MSSEKKITLKSSDGKTFKVEETVALESQTIKHMVEDNCADTVMLVPNVTSTILSKVIEYCKKHVEARSGDKKDDKSTILAAKELNIQSLLDLTTQTSLVSVGNFSIPASSSKSIDKQLSPSILSNLIPASLRFVALIMKFQFSS